MFFGTLSSYSRVRIITLLRGGHKNVSQILSELKIKDRTAISHDLARLKLHGFVKAEAKGKYRYYKLNEETIRPLMDLIDEHMSKYCIHILKAGEKKASKRPK